MTARENETKSIIADVSISLVSSSGVPTALHEQGHESIVRRVATKLVKCAVASDGGKPSAGPLGYAVSGPVVKGGRVRFLDTFFGESMSRVTRTVAARTYAHSLRCASATANSASPTPVAQVGIIGRTSTPPVGRDVSRDRERGVEVVGLNQVVAPECFLGLGECTVGDRDFAALLVAKTGGAVRCGVTRCRLASLPRAFRQRPCGSFIIFSCPAGSCHKGSDSSW